MVLGLLIIREVLERIDNLRWNKSEIAINNENGQREGLNENCPNEINIQFKYEL